MPDPTGSLGASPTSQNWSHLETKAGPLYPVSLRHWPRWSSLHFSWRSTLQQRGHISHHSRAGVPRWQVKGTRQGNQQCPSPGPASYQHIPGFHRCPVPTHVAGLGLQGCRLLGQQLPAALAHIPGGVSRIQDQRPGDRVGGRWLVPWRVWEGVRVGKSVRTSGLAQYCPCSGEAPGGCLGQDATGWPLF